MTDAKTWKPASVRAIRTGRSKDFLRWEDAAALRYVDSPEEQLYENGVKPYPRAPQILIGFPVRCVDRAGSHTGGRWGPVLGRAPGRIS